MTQLQLKLSFHSKLHGGHPGLYLWIKDHLVTLFHCAHWQHCIWRKTGNLSNMLQLYYYIMNSFLNGSLIGRLLHLSKITGSLVFWASQSFDTCNVHGAIQSFENIHSGTHSTLYSLIISLKITFKDVLMNNYSNLVGNCNKWYWVSPSGRCQVISMARPKMQIQSFIY